MTVNKLEKELNRLGIKNSAYSLTDAFANEKYCLIKENESWHVFYSERGNRNEEKVFFLEDAACSYFIEFIIRDSSVQKLN